MQIFISVLACAIALLGACSKDVPTVSYIGKIRRTEWINRPYIALDAYHAPLVALEFCTADNQLCVKGRGIGGGLRQETFESTSSGRLLITVTDNEESKLFRGTYLFDTQNGTQIVCAGCGWEDDKFYVGAWIKDGKVLFASEGSMRVGQPRIRILEINGTAATQRYVDLEDFGGKVSGWLLSPSKNALATFECTEQNCWLSWFGGELKEEHVLSVNCAKDPQYFTVYWDGDMPRIAQTAWTIGVASRHRCIDADGHPMYPVLNHDVYTEGRSATAADIKVGE